jgi:hypothetical protein
MRAPPDDLLAPLNDEERARTTAWWSTLNDDAQLEFARMWDERADDTALFGTCADGDITWHEIPIELRGALIDEENDIEHKQAKQQLLEYIANHEEIHFFLVDRQFHICRAHPVARDVIRAGHLPADFVCPVDEASCPMRTILAACPGRSVRLVPAIARVVVAAFAIALSACASKPTSCEQAACDPETEYCTLFGSDTLEPSTASCFALPDECAEAPDCACMLAAEDENSIATCEETEGGIVMTVPGG